jgi:lysozyme
MKISQKGLDLIKRFEGLKLKAYLCPANVWTVGYGSTGPHVWQGKVISEQEAEDLLKKDVERFERAVEANAKNATQNQFDALVSFAFNVGVSNLKSSTLLRLHNAGQYQAAADQFLRWNKAGRTVLPGLTRRRAQERGLYLL